MAARVTSGFYQLTLILHLFLLINYNNGENYDRKTRTLYVGHNDGSTRSKRSIIVNKNDDYFGDDDETSFVRNRRDVPQTSTPPGLSNSSSNITAKVIFKERYLFLFYLFLLSYIFLNIYNFIILNNKIQRLCCDVFF